MRSHISTAVSANPIRRLQHITSRAHVPTAVFVLTDAVLMVAILATFRLLLDIRDFAAVAFVALLLALQFGIELRHRYRIELSALEELEGVFRRTCISYALASGVAMSTGSHMFGELLALAAVSMSLLLIGRSLSYTVERSRRRRGRRLRTLVVGSDEIADRIMFAVRSRPEFGLEPIGLVDDAKPADVLHQNGTLLGGLKDIRTVIHSKDIDAVIVSFCSQRHAETSELVRAVVADVAAVWVVPRLYEFGAHAKDRENVWGLPLVELVPPGPLRASWPLKRAFDVIASALILLLLSPVLVLIAAGILVESGRPVLFKQRRVGAGGRAFDILKFRTMLPCGSEVNDTEWVPDGGRTTRFGRLLRSSGLDELPQLMNVLKGEMSLVGPRPERPFFVDRFRSTYPGYDTRHRVAGGITGYSQIHGLRGDTSIPHRATADNYYIDSWTLGTDIKILLRSLPSLVAPPRVLDPSGFGELKQTTQPLVPAESPADGSGAAL
jgi:exopolysaccharide biosynthesis polyprenyl glycosylphosphotransferase